MTFQFNIVRNSSSGINLTGYDSPNQSGQTNNIRIRYNLFSNLTRALGGAGWFLLIGDEPRDIVVDHNTADFDGTTAVFAHGGSAAAPKQITGFQFTNNAVRHGDYGINGANSLIGKQRADGVLSGSRTSRGNWLQGGTASRYPAGNRFSGHVRGGLRERRAAGTTGRRRAACSSEERPTAPPSVRTSARCSTACAA